ncbi:MAG: hypothetical protein J5705_06885 [Bacteroidaceae bacterium]|nr:hypothetical protein [Bacteroidaceae bacterium]
MRMINLKVNRVFVTVWILTILLSLSSCIRNHGKDELPRRTVLVYMAADNNLSQYANPNLYSMNTSIKSGAENTNLIVFVDRAGVAPVLLKLHDMQIDTVKVYSEVNSADASVFAEVVDFVINKWKAESYGLLMWSHGNGWVPTSMLHYVAPNMRYAPKRGSNEPQSTFYEKLRDPFAETRAFAWEERKGQQPAYTCMDIDDMVSAIPDGVFDFILFDACYMGNVEIAYALRNKTRYIISSCYEIMGYGFPYHIVTKDLLNGQLLKTCREFHNYYATQSGFDQMGGVSLVKTDGLDALAECFSKIVSQAKDTIPTMPVLDLQRFDRFTNPVFFDLEDLVNNICHDKALLAEFKLQLEKCVAFKMSTPYIFKDTVEEIEIRSYCGLSVFIPRKKYESSGLNAEYRKTAWSIATGY